MSFLGDLALLIEPRIDQILEATDADSNGVDSAGTSVSNVVDDVELIALVVLFGGKVGLEFTIGVFSKRRDKVDLRPAVEADLARMTTRHRKQVSRRERRQQHGCFLVCVAAFYLR